METMKRMLWVGWFFAAAFLLGGEKEAVDSLFYRGVEAYQRGDYRTALETLTLLDRVYPSHHRETASLLLQGKIVYAQKVFDAAREVYRRLIARFPESAYADDARFGLGLCSLQEGDYLSAAREFLAVVESGTDTRLVKKAAEIATEIMDHGMPVETLYTLLEQVPGERSKAAVTIRLARREMDRERYDAARQVVQNHLARYPQTPYVLQMRELEKEITIRSLGVKKIGVILPFSGPDSDLANRLLTGIEYAWRKHQAESPSRIELVIRDSEGRILKAVKAAKELCNDPEVIALIGELHSDPTAAIAAVAQTYGVTLLSPIAAEGGLTSIGEFIFQLNASLDVRARILADYAVHGLGMRRFAFLGIGDSYGKTLRDAFVKAVSDYGGEVLAEKWFFQGMQDFSEQLKGLRGVGIERMLKDSLLVRNPAFVPPKSPYVRYVKKSFSALVDSTDLAVTAFDGLFVPAYPEELKHLLPQLAYYHFTARLLGEVTWNDPELLESSARYLEGAVFLSDFYVGPTDFRFQRFREDFQKEMGSLPGKWEVFGHDAASLLFSVVREGVRDRKGFRERLSQVKGFPGIRGDITFHVDRVNPMVTLLQFQNGRIQKIR